MTHDMYADGIGNLLSNLIAQEQADSKTSLQQSPPVVNCARRL